MSRISKLLESKINEAKVKVEMDYSDWEIFLEVITALKKEDRYTPFSGLIKRVETAIKSNL
jgi:hypothetical protein